MKFRRSKWLAGAAAAGIALTASILSPGFSASAAASSPAEKSADVASLNVPIAIDGPTVDVATRAGQPVRLTFRAKAGQHLGIGLFDVTFAPASASALVVTARRADGTWVPMADRVHCLAATASRPDGSCQGQFVATQDGDHAIEVDTPFTAAARFKAMLSTAVEQPLAVGARKSVSLKRTGQEARFPLEAKEGEGVAVAVSDIEGISKNAAVALRIRHADGKLVGTTIGTAASGVSMPVAGPRGRYVAEVVTVHGGPASFVVSAKGVGALTVDGVPVTFDSATSSDIARFAFNGTAGEDISVAVGALALDPDVQTPALLAILAPDGTGLQTTSCSTRLQFVLTPCKVMLSKLAFTGRYIAEFRPAFGSKASGRIVASRDVTGRIEPGQPVRISGLKPGQVARYTFSGNQGERVGVSLAGLSVAPEGSRVFLTLAIHGIAMLTRSGPEAALQIDPRALPATGEYSVIVDAGAGALASGELTLLKP